jgi:hypothetical protein
MMKMSLKTKGQDYTKQESTAGLGSAKENMYSFLKHSQREARTALL